MGFLLDVYGNMAYGQFTTALQLYQAQLYARNYVYQSVYELELYPWPRGLHRRRL